MIKDLYTASPHMTVGTWPHHGLAGGRDFARAPGASNSEVYWDIAGRDLALKSDATVLGDHASLSFTPDADAAITWAIEKMREEKVLKALCEENPALRNAYDTFNTIYLLVKSNGT